MYFVKAPGKILSAQKDGSESLQSQVIDWLRFPLAIAVVFVHSFGLPKEIDLIAMQADPLSGMSFFNWVRICFSHVLASVAVPTFFVISGYLFFHKWQQWDKERYLKKMKSRFRTLVIPYLCWNAIFIPILIGLKIAAYFVKGKPLSNIPLYFEENGWLRVFWNGSVSQEVRTNWFGMPVVSTYPIDFPLWFLRDLIVVTALTPLIYWFLKKTRHYGLFLLGLAYVSGGWSDYIGLSATSLFFFSAGAYFSIYGKALIDECRKVRIGSYILVIPLLLLLVWLDGSHTEVGRIISPFYVIVGVCAAFNIAAWLLETGRTRVIPLLAHSTFFIYASHGMLVTQISVFLLTPLESLGHPFVLTLVYLMRPFLTAGICILLFLGLRKFFPRVLGVLTGNRS